MWLLGNSYILICYYYLLGPLHTFFLNSHNNSLKKEHRSHFTGKTKWLTCLASGRARVQTVRLQSFFTVHHNDKGVFFHFRLYFPIKNTVLFEIDTVVPRILVFVGWWLLILLNNCIFHYHRRHPSVIPLPFPGVVIYYPPSLTLCSHYEKSTYKIT